MHLIVAFERLFIFIFRTEARISTFLRVEMVNKLCNAAVILCELSATEVSLLTTFTKTLLSMERCNNVCSFGSRVREEGKEVWSRY